MLFPRRVQYPLSLRLTTMTGALLKGSTADFPLPVLCALLTLTAISRPYVGDSYALPFQVSRYRTKDVPYAFLLFPSASIWKPWGAQVLTHDQRSCILKKVIRNTVCYICDGNEGI